MDWEIKDCEQGSPLKNEDSRRLSLCAAKAHDHKKVFNLGEIKDCEQGSPLKTGSRSRVRTVDPLLVREVL